MKPFQKILATPIAFTFAILVSLALLNLGCQRVQPIPGIVQGPSMAPHWLGEHRLSTCMDCQYPLRFELKESDTVTRQVVCPNCGFAENRVVDSAPQPAQTVSIHYDRPISRWDVVAAKLPNSNLMGIKRVIGLPGEHLQIRRGEIYINGQLLVKPWDLQSSLRIPVYDSRFQTQATHLPRWIAEDSLEYWGQSNGIWRYQTSVNQAEGDAAGKLRFDTSESSAGPPNWSWLTYQHWRCCAHRGQRQDLFPLEDLDSFNPSLPRDLRAMVDFSFEVIFSVGAGSELGWRIDRGDKCFECRLNVDNHQLALYQGTRQSRKPNDVRDLALLATAELPKELIRFGQTNQLEVSTFDNLLVIWLNERVLVEQCLPDPVGELPARFLQMGATSGCMELKQVRIWRDIYYLAENQSDFQLPADSYFLVGDNVPVSNDSRHWQPAGVSRKNILGIVKPIAN